jgi:O-antigen/teichoic acid export membrane protein
MRFLQAQAMKHKLIMVFGAAGAKVFPILFGLYLSRVFGFADYANFILIVTYAAALTAVAAMGSAPQILRLGAVDEPEKHVVTIVTIGVFFTIVLVVLSSLFWFFLSSKPLVAQGDGLGALLLGAMALGLICYAISQAVFNVNGKFRVAGISSIVIYAGSAVLGVLIGFLSDRNTLALLAYFTFFMIASLVFLFISQRHYIQTWRMYSSVMNAKELIAGMKVTLHTSLFGVVTLVGFFIIMAIVHATLNIHDSAVFAMSFQLFQAGIFLPSILGSIMIPHMVSATKKADFDAERKVHQKIRILYLVVGVVWTGLVAVFAYPLLRLYGFDQNIESAYAVVLFQIAGIFAVMQAYHIQKGVSSGRFGLLAIAAIIWLLVALIALKLLAESLLSAVFSLVIAYGVSFFFYEGYSALTRKRI